MGVEEGGTYSLAGSIRTIHPPHSFVTRSGRQSSVRNLVIADETGEIPVVIWGEKAEEYLVPGDRIEIYNAGARRGRYGDLELHISWGSALVVLAEEEREVEVEGTIIATAQGICIDTGDDCYLLAEPLPVGYDVRVRVWCTGDYLCLSPEAVFPIPGSTASPGSSPGDLILRSSLSHRAASDLYVPAYTLSVTKRSVRNEMSEIYLEDYQVLGQPPAESREAGYGTLRVLQRPPRQISLKRRRSAKALPRRYPCRTEDADIGGLRRAGYPG